MPPVDKHAWEHGSLTDRRSAFALAAALLLLPLAACDKPEVADTADVRATDAALAGILQDLYTARGTYGAALDGMPGYWVARGYGTRAIFAGNELEDLAAVPHYLYDRTDEDANLMVTAVGVGGRPFRLEGSEVDLVERFADVRLNYHAALAELVDYLAAAGDARVNQAREEQRLANWIRPYHYLRPIYIPAGLTPRDSIGEANALYERGLADINRLRYIPAVGVALPKETNLTARRGLAALRTLIEQYPTSDKIDDAAYYMGYFCFEYLGDNESAAQFFEKAVEYNPDFQKPARFRAAITYDYRLHNREAALRLYAETIRRETLNQSNARWAADRIEALTNRDPEAPSEPPPPIE